MARIIQDVQSMSVTLTPESIYITRDRTKVSAFHDTVFTVFGEFGIADELKKKLFSVVGSPEYFRGKPGEPARWSWTLNNMEITYSHFPEMDRIDAHYADKDSR